MKSKSAVELGYGKDSHASPTRCLLASVPQPTFIRPHSSFLQYAHKMCSISKKSYEFAFSRTRY